jgi:hypothetical protein
MGLDHSMSTKRLVATIARSAGTTKNRTVERFGSNSRLPSSLTEYMDGQPWNQRNPGASCIAPRNTNTAIMLTSNPKHSESLIKSF